MRHETILALFKALANDSRLRLVGLLARKEQSVQQLAAALGLSEPTISHHLAVLKTVGLARCRIDGTTHWHSLDRDALGRLGKAVLSADGFAAEPNPLMDPSARVIANYFDGDRLVSIPASRKKRWHVLKFLTERFAAGTIYPEAELNRIIQKHHWDAATLRREMIGYGMMAREAGRYWRLPEANWEPPPA